MLSKVEMFKKMILDNIASDRLKPGDLLPSRHQYMKRFGCARGTIDAVIRALVQDGYLYSRRGSGTYVSNYSRGTAIQKVIIVDDFRNKSRGEILVSSGSVASQLQSKIPCFVYRCNELSLKLGELARPSIAFVWIRPSYSNLIFMEYLKSAGCAQLLVGREYGDFDYVTTDSYASVREGVEWLNKRVGNELYFVTPELSSAMPYMADRHVAFYESCIETGCVINKNQIFKVKKSALKGAVEEIFSFNSSGPKGVFIPHVEYAYPFVLHSESLGKQIGNDYFILHYDSDVNTSDYTGVANLRQKWSDMEDCVERWVGIKTKNINDNYKIKIKTELIER